MRYSQRLRSSVLRKVLPPESRPVSNVSEEFGVSIPTIQSWMRLARKGIVSPEDNLTAPKAKPMAEKFELVLENARLAETNKGEWLREKGLHEEHLGLWEQELRSCMSEKQDKKKAETAALKKRNRQLEKELARKDKALAELAALLTLKKKLAEILPDDEDG